MVYSNQATIELCVVHLLERQVGFFLGFESHKPESAASVGISVFDDDSFIHLSEVLKPLSQSLVGCVPGKAPDEELRHAAVDRRRTDMSASR